ncbi:MAG: OsmC family protein [Armatimonadota bacterium]|nr:OsmC family protein [Armatimonadota bacterium]
MVEIEARYDGSKKCTMTHQEGITLKTDAPKDIGGDASAFSPTDLVASALAACVLTTVAMFAERHELDLTGMTAHISKEMNASPRRIGHLPLTVHLPASVSDEMRSALERVAHSCPVHASLHPDVDVPIMFHYDL